MIDVIIVGGGVSGVVASIFAKNKKNHVVVLERNHTPLKKLLMTGNGKCNFFNEDVGVEHYHSLKPDLISQMIQDENIQAAWDFFDRLGIIYKNKNGYYYPFSNQASTLQKALLAEALRRGVEFVCDCLVTDIRKTSKKFFVFSRDKDFCCDCLVIATGSFAYPKTGSDGMGYSFLRSLGHSIIKPLPALVPLVCEGSFLKDWNGVRSDVVLELWENNKKIAEEKGEIQLTDYGISGICTFNLSHFVSRGLAEGRKEIIKINFVPFVESDSLMITWMNQFSQKYSEKTIEELLDGLLNAKLVSTFLKLCDIPKNVYYKDLSTDTKLLLCEYLRSFPLEITGTKSFSEAQVCNGGIPLSEVHLDTFESKKVNRLYITGELLDITGDCGGYNLIVCWISGILAGKSIGEIHD